MYFLLLMETTRRGRRVSPQRRSCHAAVTASPPPAIRRRWMPPTGEKIFFFKLRGALFFFSGRSNLFPFLPPLSSSSSEFSPRLSPQCFHFHRLRKHIWRSRSARRGVVVEDRSMPLPKNELHKDKLGGAMKSRHLGCKYNLEETALAPLDSPVWSIRLKTVLVYVLY